MDKNLKYSWIPLIALFVFYCWRSWDFPIHDFANYYCSAEILSQGRLASWIYFPYEFNRSIMQSGHIGIFASFAPNTPFVALFFLPLSFLPIAIAKLIFNVCSCVLFLFSLNRIFRYYKIDLRYLVLIPVLFFVPIKNEILFGQFYFVLFFLIAETWLAYKNGDTFWAAFYLALAVLLKVFPVLLIFIFIYRKKYQFLAYFAGCIIVLWLLCSLFVPVNLWSFYFQKVLPRASNGEIASEYVTNYQSLLMFFKTAFVANPTLNLNAWLDLPTLFVALIWAIKIKIIAVGYDVSRKVKTPLVALSYWILAMLLISPYGSTYTFILLVFAFLALALNPIYLPKKIMGFVLLFVICNLPLEYFEQLEFPFNYLRLFALIGFFILWFTLFSKKVKVVRVGIAAACAFAVSFALFKYPTTDAAFALEHNNPIMVSGFKIENQALIYHYQDDKGNKTGTLPINIKTAKAAQLHNNEIFWNGFAVPSDNGNKRQPIVVDGKTLYYLSDYGRGIGFYTIWKRELK